MAILQVAINPLLRVAGGEEHFAFNSVMAQLFFGLASFLSPLVYSYVVTNMSNESGETDIIITVLASLAPTEMSLDIALLDFCHGKHFNGGNYWGN